MPSIVGVILRLVVAALAGYLTHWVLQYELLATMASIILVPIIGLFAIGLVLNAYGLDSIRLFWLITLGDITGIAGIFALGIMIASMDQSMFMVNAAAVIAGAYLLIKLAMHYDTA